MRERLGECVCVAVAVAVAVAVVVDVMMSGKKCCTRRQSDDLVHAGGAVTVCSTCLAGLQNISEARVSVISLMTA